MRRLVYVAATLVTLLCGTWFVVAAQIEARVESAIADLRARGWTVTYGSLSVDGFPTRFATTATEIHVVSPNGSVVWDAPSFQVAAMSYRPNRVVAEWPETQSLTVAGQHLEVSSRGLTTSATAGMSADLPLNAATVGTGLATVEADSGWGFGVDGLMASMMRTGSAYDLLVEAEGLRPATVNANIGLLRLDLQVAVDTPVTLRSGPASRFQGVDLRKVRLSQGDVAVTGTGALSPDAAGYLAGSVTLAVEDWRGLLDLLDAAGLLAYDRRPLLEGAFQELSQGSDRIEVPVTFESGQIVALGLVLMDSPHVF